MSQAKKLAQAEFLRWFKMTHGINPILRYFNEKDSKLPTLYLMGDQVAPRSVEALNTHSFQRLLEATSTPSIESWGCFQTTRTLPSLLPNTVHCTLVESLTLCVPTELL